MGSRRRTIQYNSWRGMERNLGDPLGGNHGTRVRTPKQRKLATLQSQPDDQSDDNNIMSLLQLTEVRRIYIY